MHPSQPPGYIPDPLYDEKRLLFRAVDQFALQMKSRLVKKLDAGWVGWDSEDILPLEECHRRLLACVSKSPLALDQEADIANFALFLWWRRLSQPVAADSTADERAGL